MGRRFSNGAGNIKKKKERKGERRERLSDRTAYLGHIQSTLIAATSLAAFFQRPTCDERASGRRAAARSA